MDRVITSNNVVFDALIFGVVLLVNGFKESLELILFATAVYLLIVSVMKCAAGDRVL